MISIIMFREELNERLGEYKIELLPANEQYIKLVANSSELYQTRNSDNISPVFGKCMVELMTLANQTDATLGNYDIDIILWTSVTTMLGDIVENMIIGQELLQSRHL